MTLLSVWPPTLTSKTNADTRARLGHWVCYACGHVRRTKNAPPYCHQCGAPNGYAWEEIRLQGARSDEIEELPPGILIPEWKVAFPEGIPLGRSLVMRGRPGVGKSRIGFRLASQIGTTAAFVLEMGKVLSRDSAQKVGAHLERFWWYEDMDGLAELELIHPKIIVVDSVQKLGRQRKSIVARLRQWAMERDATLILVSQKGKHGASRHGEDDDFDCDVVADVEHGTTPQEARSAIHGFDGKPTRCKMNHAHIVIAKSRICPLVAFDVPIVNGA